ncbi:uncharacterized protein LOC108671396 [Hyalella azteca]|uniref:Uncharacterized protein LOC108671396 n=1 Tax=Hyalella azteca TaxID=294128 RepID=A0A8B7NLA6_HYAAZ|nr:uncharacterized protein LOC108671396 [Hyalella azteca]
MAAPVLAVLVLTLLSTGILGEHFMTGNELDNDLQFQKRPNFVYENAERCMALGGVCTQSMHCLQSYEDSGLCGSAPDIVCCEKLPNVCHARGGECLPRGECGGGRHAPVFLDAECDKEELACCVRT